MSADTTLLVLGTLTGEVDEKSQPVREYRVAVVQAVENAYLDPTDPKQRQWRDDWLKASFRHGPQADGVGDSDVFQVTLNRDQALTQAAELFHRWAVRGWILEYGVVLLELDEPFPD